MSQTDQLIIVPNTPRITVATEKDLEKALTEGIDAYEADQAKLTEDGFFKSNSGLYLPK